VILLLLADGAEVDVVFVARTICMIWLGAPVIIAIDVSIHPKARIARTNMDLCFCI